MGTTHNSVSDPVAPIKVSVVTTVLNEEDSIHSLLDSLLNQSHLPDELIIVDAGSTDQTPVIIREHQQSSPFPLALLSLKGTNRSEGRNQGISAARYDHVAVIDAGCEADRHWLEHLINGFEAGHDSVAGFYLASINKPIQHLFIPFLAVSPNRLDVATFLPSSRSLAFTKTAWETAGRYPEQLPTCEDLVFAHNLKTHTSMVVAPKALVYWHIAATLPQFFKQMAGYAVGDVLAGYQPHVYKILSMWSRYIGFLLLPALLVPYIGIRIFLHRAYITTLSYLPWYTATMFTADIAVLWGSFKGWLRLLRGFSQNPVRKETS